MTKWYSEGLRFECTGCGGCCTGAPGYVFITPDEIEMMAEALGISFESFCQKYVRKVNNRYSLIEDRKTYDCCFLQGKQCTIYHARPRQCRTFPFWPQNLVNEEAWLETAKECEGINAAAPLIPLERIEAAD